MAQQAACSVVITNLVYSMAICLTQLVLVIPSLTPLLVKQLSLQTVDLVNSEVKVRMIYPMFWCLNLDLSTVSCFYK